MNDTGHESWQVWSCDASVVVTDPALAHRAAAIAREVIDEVDAACSRFRQDSEVMRLAASLADGIEVSPMLAQLVSAALYCAALTDGDVDPTLGNDLVALGYDRDFFELTADRAPVGAELRVACRERRPGWSRLALDGSTLTVPADLLLDLGASAKAFTADRAAAEIARRLGGGALVSIGGDIATAGTEPTSGWEVLVQDTAADPAQQVTLRPGSALATSSTQKRRWLSAGVARHHILDPRVGLPVEAVWRTVTVAAETCLRANALSTGAIVRGFRAVPWLQSLGVPARFVDVDGRVVTTGPWPAPFPEFPAAKAVRS